MRARIVLADCEMALADFNASVNANEFMRPRWVSLITLLRAVGHVLEKVDRPVADRDAQMRAGAAWDQLAATATLSAFSMSDGPYKGRDPRQLAREAIEFWCGYLDAIESEAEG